MATCTFLSGGSGVGGQERNKEVVGFLPTVSLALGHALTSEAAGVIITPVPNGIWYYFLMFPAVGEFVGRGRRK